MSSKEIISGYVNYLFKKIAYKLGIKYLPLIFNRKLLLICIDSWKMYRISYEQYIADLLNKNLKLNDIFFDVGSHIGLWSLYTQSIVGEKGKIIAFEPSPAFNLLKKNINRYSNCIAYNYGVSNTNEKLSFFAQGTGQSNSFNQEITTNSEYKRPGVAIKELKIDAITLDNFCKKHNVIPNLIKIDVEGHELKVLEGAKNVLLLNGPKLIIEIHSHRLKFEGYNEKNLLEFLSKCNYSYKTINNEGKPLYTIYAVRKE